MDYSLNVLGVSRARLLDFPALQAYVDDRVWEVVQKGQTISYPYLTMSTDQSDITYAQMYEGTNLQVDIHVWSRHTNGTSSECRRVGNQVMLAMKNHSFDIGQDAEISLYRCTGSRYFRDSDGSTWHGVISFEVHVGVKQEDI